MRKKQTEDKNNSEQPAWNVLIVDPDERSCLLVKSILIGEGCRVSISSNWDPASVKLETGLFDAVFLEIASPEERKQARSLLDNLTEEIPVTTGAISNCEMNLEMIAPERFQIDKPIRISEVRNVLRRMKKERDQSEPEKKKHQIRSTFSCRIQLSSSQREMSCRSISLNPQGIFTEPESKEEEELLRFHQFFEESGEDSFRVSFQAGEDQISIPARKIFTERTPNEQIHGVGFRFDLDRNRIQNKIQKLSSRGA